MTRLPLLMRLMTVLTSFFGNALVGTLVLYSVRRTLHFVLHPLRTCTYKRASLQTAGFALITSILVRHSFSSSACTRAPVRRKFFFFYATSPLFNILENGVYGYFWRGGPLFLCDGYGRRAGGYDV